MIISASRRTDIPALYPDWFMNRLRAGEVLVPNPYNRKKVSRICLSPDTVDMIAFWTRNPEPLLPHLAEIDARGYDYYFQVTINDYEDDIEPLAPCKADVMASFLLMSEKIGRERMDWRFGPICLDEKYTVAYHLEHFERMCRWLHNATTRCIVSFADSPRGKVYSGQTTQKKYPDEGYSGCQNIWRKVQGTGIPGEITQKDMEELAAGLGAIAARYHLPLYTCSAKADLQRYGIRQGSCIDKEKIQSLKGYRLDIRKAAGQRKECHCVENLDIGMYDTCMNGCHYCYINVKGTHPGTNRKHEKHDPASPMLLGYLLDDEVVTEKKVFSNRDNQMSLFDMSEILL
jgi:hypothetical protein